VDLGIAMQLTNICRDIAEDAANGRRYLPATLIGDCPAEDLVFPCESLQPQIQKAVAQLLQKADTYYRSGERGLPYLPTRARFGILAAARVYRAIGERLRARDHAYWLGRAMVTDRRKAAITALALAAAPMRPSFWWASSPHEHGLHWALRGLPGIGGTHEN
jgi:phytoene synthase